MSENTFLSLRHLEKVYSNGEKAVYNFDLDIDRNEFIVIVGPSGCGKSTTLRMIAGLEDITSGDIYLENELLNFKPCKDRKMAIVFQSYALYPQMNVYDNIAFPLTINTYPFPAVAGKLKACAEVREILQKEEASAALENLPKKSKDRAEAVADRLEISLAAAKLYLSLTAEEAPMSKLEALESAAKEEAAAKKLVYNEKFELLDQNGNVKMEDRKMTSYEIRRKVYDTAEILDLVPYLDKLPKELSGGQMQRVALGRAIVKNVPVFLMDEPLSNLDAKLRLTMRSEIVKLHNRINATTIYVTHDQTEAMTMATKIVVMSKGFIQQIGTPEEVYSRPANIFVAKFVGSPSMNIFEATYCRETGELVYGDFRIPLSEDFRAKHDEFYRAKAEELGGALENFGDPAREMIKKILSATGEKFETTKKVKKKGFKRLVGLFKRDKEEESAAEKPIAEEMVKKLNACLEGDHILLAGVRPERIRVEKYDPSKTYENCIIVKPTVCELLGSEYNVHIEYCNKSIVGQVDAKEKITTKDDLAVTFSGEDVYLFDPITGEVLK